MDLVRKYKPDWVTLSLWIGLLVLILFFALTILAADGILLAIALERGARASQKSRRKIRHIHDSESYKTAYTVDVSHENRQPPVVLHSTIQPLHDLQFQRLGETGYCRADGTEMACSWIFVSADRQVTAELVPNRIIPGGLLMGFQSILPGPAWLLTDYPIRFPRAEKITEPELRTRHTHRSLLDAHDMHRAELIEFARQRGEPVQIRSITDLLTYEPIFRNRHMSRRLRRSHLLTRLNTTLVGGTAGLMLIGLGLSFIVPELAILIFVLGFSAVCLYYSYAVPTHLRTARRFRVGIGVALGLLPLSFLWHGFVLLHSFLLGLMLNVFLRSLPAEAKGLVKDYRTAETAEDLYAAIAGKNEPTVQG